MRDLVVCLPVFLSAIVGFSAGRWFGSTPHSEQASGCAYVAPDPTLTIVSRIATADAASKAEVQPPLDADGPHADAKPAAQPPLLPELVTVAAPADKPEKIMVGPDGVVYVRTNAPTRKPMAAAHPSHPLAPESLGLAEQAKASEPAVVARGPTTEVPSTATPDANPKPENSPLVTENKNESNPPSPAAPKSDAIMAGPDGVIYQPAGSTHALTPR
jgi:hypothetical protein